MNNSKQIIENLSPADREIWRQYLTACSAESEAETEVFVAQRKLMFTRRKTQMASEAFLQTEGGKAWDQRIHAAQDEAAKVRLVIRGQSSGE